MNSNISKSDDGFDGARTAGETPPYYAKDGKVWKSPVKRRNENGGTSITLGFPVCEMHEAAADQASTVAEMLNRSELVDDLVEALKSAAESIEQLVKLNRIPANNKGLRDARAALSKATGEAK